MDTFAAIASVLWGFLVGLIAWLGTFKAPEPIADWLFEGTRPSYVLKGVTRAVVMLFLFYATMNVIAFMPLCLTVWNLDRIHDVDRFWRMSFGLAFWSSIRGVFVLFALRRLARKSD